MPFTEVGRLDDVVIPAHTTITRCITWTRRPVGEHEHLCLQIRIEQEGYEDIISQRNIDIVGLPGAVHLHMEHEF